MVVRSPTWPPDSPPSATIAHAPMRSHILAMATEGTTGMTLRPFSTQFLMYLEGSPAPVTTTGTFSSTTTCATSSAKGESSITFTPKGLSVISRIFWISARSCSPLEFMPAMMPRPPALETAPASDASDTQAMPP